MDKKETFELVKETVGRRKGKFYCKDEAMQVMFEAGNLPEDVNASVTCVITVDGNYLFARSAVEEKVPKKKRKDLLLFANKLNNLCRHAKFSVSEDLVFYIEAAVNMERKEVSVSDIDDIVGTVLTGIMIHAEYARSIFQEDVKPMDAYEKLSHDVSDKYEDVMDYICDNNIWPDEDDYDEDGNYVGNEVADEAAYLQIICNGINGRDDNYKSANIFADDIQYGSIKTGEYVEGLEKVFASDAFTAKGKRRNCIVAALTEDKVFGKGKPAFPKGTPCIIKEYSRKNKADEIMFISVNESQKIDGIYTDALEGYSWKQIV